MKRVLIIDDEESMLTILTSLLSKEGYSVQAVSDGRQGLKKLESGELPDLVITDIKMPDIDGIEVLREVKSMDPYLPVVIISAHADKQKAIDACNEGAYYFLEKPFPNRNLLDICREALEHSKVGRRFSERRRQLSSARPLEEPIGEAPKFKEAMRIAEKAARTDSTILIQGKSGTGKELVAKYIYRKSARKDRPFVPVNCGALTETLLESELFGHLKGSFSGAHSNKDGLFKVASGGTIFLDEIGETSLSFQVKLLRVLQEKTITPVGSTEQVPVDVRVIAATNKDLEAEVKAGRFRLDLYYRLNVIPIVVPPLSERKEDIPLLIDYFLERNGEKADHKERFTEEDIFRGFDIGDLLRDLGFGTEDIFGRIFGRRGFFGDLFGAARADVEMELPIGFREAAFGTEKTVRYRYGHRVEEVRVRIPPGVDTGTRLRISTPRGNLYLRVRVLEDPVFRREGFDLYVEQPVRLSQLLLGDTVEVPTLEGPRRVRIPPGTQPGAKVRLRGHGLPMPGGGRGDLFLIPKLQLPQRLTERQRRLVEELSREGM